MSEVTAVDEIHCDPNAGNTAIAAAFSLVFFAAWFLSWRVIFRPSSDGGLEKSKGGGRTAVLDNAKFLLMITVVLTHSQTYGWPGSSQLMGYVNPWHIKTYAFISGVLSTKPPSVLGFKRIVFRLILPNILWCIILYPIMKYLVAWRFPESFAEVELLWSEGIFNGRAATNWYLWALIWWQIFSNFLQAFPRRLRLAVAVFVSAVTGYQNEDLFSFLMACPTLPIFVAGQLFPFRDVLSRVPYSWRVIACGSAFMIVLLLLEALPPGFDYMEDTPKYGWAPDQPSFWWGRQPAICSTGGRWAVWIRGAVFRNALELTKALVFLICVCPRSPSFMTELGQYSLYPMLLHEPIMKLQLIWFAEDNAWTMPHPANGALLTLAWIGQIAFATLVTVVFAMKPVRAVFGCIIEPVWAERLVEKVENYEARLDEVAAQAGETRDLAAATGEPTEAGAKGQPAAVQEMQPVVAVGPSASEIISV
eukprot:TRINITY_DN74695_c0_g1_i1.p1 TRINITY_DN74695_c0_g1~~TRINITY_DN74695_c0_g1_i1.p1  ORF type:complete len:477 (+),score=44.94 TRINITY_DN74695_c0_g1_i1:148-1578(+)